MDTHVFVRGMPQTAQRCAGWGCACRGMPCRGMTAVVRIGRPKISWERARARERERDGGKAREMR